MKLKEGYYVEAASDIDAGFIGMDMRVDPRISRRVTFRMPRIVASQMVSLISVEASPVCTGPTTVSYDGEGKPSIDKIDPFIEPIAIGVFRDPLDEEVALIAANDKVWRCYPNNTARELSLPAGEKTGKDVKFIQAFDTVLMLRGKDKPMLKLDAARFRFEKHRDRGSRRRHRCDAKCIGGHLHQQPTRGDHRSRRGRRLRRSRLHALRTDQGVVPNQSGQR